MKKILLIAALLLTKQSLLQAQTVTEDWATLLANSAVARVIVIDASGNVYTANVNSTVSKVTPDGTLTRAWATLASSDQPLGIGIDASGNIYTANYGNHTVSKIAPDGTVTDPWTTLPATAGPSAIAVDASGNVYVGGSTYAVSKIAPDGTTTATWASLPGGSEVYALAVDASGNVYTTSWTNSIVNKIAPDGTIAGTWTTPIVSAVYRGIAIDASGNVYTANNGTNTISKIAPDGTFTQPWATLPTGAYCDAIAIDASGNLYTANNSNGTVSKITPGDIITDPWATLNATAEPNSIAIDPSGNIYTVNFNNTISKITPDIVMPVTLLDFSGTLQNSVANLQWQTATEAGFSHFELQSSIDSKTYMTVANIAAKGNNSSYADTLVQTTTITYYRLKMVDIDGHSVYSNTLALSQTNEVAGVVLYPNPSNTNINIKVATAGSLSIYDASGKLVINKMVQVGVNTVNVSNLNAGIYYCVVGGVKLSFVKE